MYIRVNDRDNVAIMVEPGGCRAGCGTARRPDRRASGFRSRTRSRCTISSPANRSCATARSSASPTAPSRPAAGCARRLLDMPAAPPLDELPLATAVPPALPPLEGYTFEGYRNADGGTGTQEHPGHRHHRAVRGAHRGVRRAAHPGGDPAALSQRGRRGRDHPLLWLRRGHRRARRRRAHPHPEAHRAARQPGGAAAGGQPGLRETAARAAVRGDAGDLPDSGRGQRDPPAGRARLRRERRRDHAGRRKAPGGTRPAAPADGARRRNWWWACNAAAATPSPASPAIRRWAMRPTCWCAPAPP